LVPSVAGIGHVRRRNGRKVEVKAMQQQTKQRRSGIHYTGNKAGEGEGSKGRVKLKNP